jgi:hypothetical protein
LVRQETHEGLRQIVGSALQQCPVSVQREPMVPP